MNGINDTKVWARKCWNCFNFKEQVVHAGAIEKCRFHNNKKLKNRLQDEDEAKIYFCSASKTGQTFYLEGLNTEERKRLRDMKMVDCVDGSFREEAS